MRKQEKVLVPALVGLDVCDAHQLAFAARVVAVGPDPEDPLPITGTVTAQAPAPGTRVVPAAPVVIAVDPGGGRGGGGGGSLIEPPPPGPRDPAGTK